MADSFDDETTTRIADPNAKPYKCKFCRESRATWDQKEKFWRPPPINPGKTPICPHCGKEQKQPAPEPEPLKLFIKECSWAWCLWNEYKALCELDGNQNDVANVRKFVNQFVVEMRTILQHYLILRICSLVDSPFWTNANEEKIENLTIDNLIKTLPLPAALKASLETRSGELKKIVSPLLPARNRIIAHIDKRNALENNTLGAMKDGAYERFFELLEEMINDMHAAIYPDPNVVGQINYVRCAMPDGPVYEMLVHLRFVQLYLERTGKGDSRLGDL